MLTTIQPSNCTPRYLSQENGNLYSYRNLYMNIYSAFIFNSQKLETTRCLFSGEQLNNKVHLNHGILLSNKNNSKKTLLTHVTTWINLRRINYPKWWGGRALRKKVTHYVIPFVSLYCKIREMENGFGDCQGSKTKKGRQWEVGEIWL